jgi:hypothetical protein
VFTGSILTINVRTDMSPSSPRLIESTPPPDDESEPSSDDDYDTCLEHQHLCERMFASGHTLEAMYALYAHIALCRHSQCTRHQAEQIRMIMTWNENPHAFPPSKMGWARKQLLDIFITVMLARERNPEVDTSCNDKSKQLAAALALTSSRPFEMIAEALFAIWPACVCRCPPNACMCLE